MNILIYSIKFIHINSQKLSQSYIYTLLYLGVYNGIEKSKEQKYKKNTQSLFSYKITDKSIIA